MIKPAPASGVAVSGGPGSPASTHLEADPEAIAKAVHTVRPQGPLPDDEASSPNGHGEASNPAASAPPVQDVRSVPEEPSVWEAVGRSKE
jgi:hypothetical protein